LDALRQAFVDRTLEVSLHAANKVGVGATFVKVTADKPPGPDAKARKAAADKRKPAVASTTVVRAPHATKTTDTTRPPQKK
jgi:hypothetical protein